MMKAFTALLLALSLVLCLGVVGCGDEGGEQTPGTEGGICLPNDKCDPGLYCWEGICQKAP